MSEGGVYPWKVQKIEYPKRGRYASVTYADLSRPLPDPPGHQTWVQSAHTREWKLVPLVVASSSSARHPVVVAVARRVSPRRQQQQAGTGTGTSACDAHPDDDDDDDDDAVLTAAVPVIVDGEAASAYAIPPTATAAGGGAIRYHEVLPTDTFQGLCLRYGVTPTELRRANKMLMTGSDLKLAPEVLVVPSNGKNNARLLDDDGRRRPPTKGEMIATLVHRVSRATKDRLTHSEALAYLDMADGDVDGAVANAREDFGWSAEEGKIGAVIAAAGGASSSRIAATGGGGGSSSGADVFRSSRLLGDGRLGRGRRPRQHPRGLRHVLGG